MHTPGCNWNKPGMSDDDNNRNDETDYDEIDDDDDNDESDVNDEDEPQKNQELPTVMPPRNPTRRRFEVCRRVLGKRLHHVLMELLSPRWLLC